MDIGSILVSLAVLLLAAFLISQPLLDRRRRDARALSEPDRLREQRDRILATLGDLDFDHASGKIQEEDYATLRANLVGEGAAVLKRLDDLTRATPAQEGQLEASIAAHRQRPASKSGDALEQAIAARRQRSRSAAASGEKSFCPNCGQAALADDKFCAKCGGKLPGAPSTKDSA